MTRVRGEDDCRDRLAGADQLCHCVGDPANVTEEGNFIPCAIDSDHRTVGLQDRDGLEVKAGAIANFDKVLGFGQRDRALTSRWRTARINDCQWHGTSCRRHRNGGGHGWNGSINLCRWRRSGWLGDSGGDNRRRYRRIVWRWRSEATADATRHSRQKEARNRAENPSPYCHAIRSMLVPCSSPRMDNSIGDSFGEGEETEIEEMGTTSPAPQSPRSRACARHNGRRCYPQSSR